LAVQPTFAQELVYAPDRDWASLLIDEMCRYDGLTDSATQAIHWLRNTGWARTDAEIVAEKAEARRYKPRLAKLYPC
jgi:hypothetical protein